MNDFNPPQTVHKAIEHVLSALPLKDRVYVAGLTERELGLIHQTLGAYLRDEWGLATGNTALIESCRQMAGRPQLTADQALEFLIRELWKILRDSHRLRALDKRGH